MAAAVPLFVHVVDRACHGFAAADAVRDLGAPGAPYLAQLTSAVLAHRRDVSSAS